MERIAVVTGAARGIGLAITRALLKDELTVVGVDVNEAGLSATAEKLTADGASFVPKLADLADPTQVARIFAEIEETFGGVDALVNNQEPASSTISSILAQMSFSVRWR